VTIIMFILDRFSPYGYRAGAKESGEGDGNEFSLSNSLWFATGSILQQGADTTPRAGSGRVLAAAFWLFTLILISTYTANLAAYFTGVLYASYIVMNIYLFAMFVCLCLFVHLLLASLLSAI